MTARRQSPLAKARGLGAAGTGTDVWFMQRLTWAATIVLSFLVLGLMLGLIGQPFTDLKAALSGFWATLLLILFVAVASYHYVLELTEVIEDYVHNRALELALLLLVRCGFAILGLGAILMTLRNFFGS